MSRRVMQEEYMEFDFLGEHFRAHFRVDSPKFFGQDKDPKYMRAYVSLPASLQPSEETLKDVAQQVGVDSIYTTKGDYPALNKAWKEYNRAEVVIMKHILEATLVIAHKHNLLDWVKLHDATYSRVAGCSCGCSPGFIIRGVNGNYNLWVDRYNADEEEERIRQVAEARENRLNQARQQLAEKLESLPMFDLTQEQCDKLLNQIERL